jgi:TusA-related sulfurtransferase
MPYSKTTDAPKWVQDMGEKAAKQWIAVWNSVFDETKNEEKAFKAAAAAVKGRDEKKMAAECAFQFISLAPLLAEDRALARGEILRVGDWIYGGQDMKVTEEMLSQAVENWKAHKRDVMLDYDHGSRVGKTPEERKRAGDLVDLELEKSDAGVALYGMFKPTDDAAGYLEKGEYKYLSAEFDEDYFHPEDKDWIGMYLLAVALTNRPYIEGMAPITLMSEAAQKSLAEYGKGGTLTVYVEDVGKLDDVKKACEEKGAKVVGWYQDVKMYAQKVAAEPAAETKTEGHASARRSVVLERASGGEFALKEV